MVHCASTKVVKMLFVYKNEPPHDMKLNVVCVVNVPLSAGTELNTQISFPCRLKLMIRIHELMQSHFGR